MKITCIEPRKRRAERVDVHVDGELRLTLAQEIVLREGLRVGDEFSEARIRALEGEDLRWKVQEAALSLLSFRARTTTELRRRLLRKEFLEEVVDECVAGLAERGLVDDASFAEAFVRDRVRLRPRGARRLVQELRARGVDADTAAEAIGEVMEHEAVSELDLAREAAARWPRRGGEDPQRARRRLHGFLARRGFGGDTVRQVVQEVEL